MEMLQKLGTLISYNTSSKEMEEFLKKYQGKRVFAILEPSEIENDMTSLLTIHFEEPKTQKVDVPYIAMTFSKVIKNVPAPGINTYIDLNNDSYTIQSPKNFLEYQEGSIELEDDYKMTLGYLWCKYGLNLFKNLDQKLSNLTKEFDAITKLGKDLRIGIEMVPVPCPLEEFKKKRRAITEFINLNAEHLFCKQFKGEISFNLDGNTENIMTVNFKEMVAYELAEKLLIHFDWIQSIKKTTHNEFKFAFIDDYHYLDESL